MYTYMYIFTYMYLTTWQPTNQICAYTCMHAHICMHAHMCMQTSRVKQKPIKKPFKKDRTPLAYQERRTKKIRKKYTIRATMDLLLSFRRIRANVTHAVTIGVKDLRNWIDAMPMNKYCALPSARVVAWHTPTGRHLQYKRECRVKKTKRSFKFSARCPVRVLSCGTRPPVNTSIFRFPCNWKELHVQYKREHRVNKTKRSFKDSARCPARVLSRGTPTGRHLEMLIEDEGENTNTSHEKHTQRYCALPSVGNAHRHKGRHLETNNMNHKGGEIKIKCHRKILLVARLYVAIAEQCLFYRALLQKRPMF